jgi:adenylosuccinate lyase
MKQKYFLKIAFCFLLISTISYGQLVTTIDFESVDTGYTPSATEGSTFIDVFNRIDRTSNALGGNNTFLFAIEDTNLSNPSIDLDQIDVTGSASFTFSIDMLAHHYDDWDDSDELLITYSLDGGGYQNLMWVQNTGDQYNAPAALDLGFDEDGDCGSGTTLPAISTGTSDGCTVSSNQFATFVTNSITLTNNSTLDIKLQFNGFTSGDEGMYFDNIIITETAASSSPTVTFDSTTSSETETDVTFATSGIPITLTNYDADVTVTATVNGSSTAEVGDYTIDLTPLVFDANETLTIPLSIKDAMNDVYVPEYFSLLEKIEGLAKDWAHIPMLARTHGQPASPTRLGKEIEVFAVRLKAQFNLLNDVPSAAKFGGATGNFNAHKVAYPNIDWKAFASKFVQEKLGLQHSFPTTQIEHYDHAAALFDALKRINTIIIDLDRDIWTYVSMDYFKQKIKAGEVGSSAMPHKVNPIDFENSEGNLGMANAIFEHLSAKLPISRLQRDLTDSTVLRNVGVPFGHTIIAFKSTVKGLGKLLLNEAKFAQDLENNWAVVAEAIQTILRRESYPNPYEALKGLTRTNEAITQNSISDFIDTLAVSDTIKSELKAITPSNYTGI